MPETREYYQIVEDFLKAIQDQDVNALVMVALINGELRDVSGFYNCSPADLGAVSGIIQLRALDRLRNREGTDAEE